MALGIEKIVFLLLAIAAFLFSLFFPVFYSHWGCDHGSCVEGPVYMGWQVLLFGWFAVFSGSVAWFANLGFLISMALYMSNGRYDFCVALISLCIALTSFFSVHRVLGYGNGPDWADVYRYGPGFYLWSLAHIILFVATGLRVLRLKHASQ